MTNREFFNAIISNEITSEVIEFAETSLAKLDEKNAKRTSKSKEANAPFKELILEALVERDWTLGTDVAKLVNLSPQKTIGLCGELVKEGMLDKSEVKVDKVGKRMAYKLC